MLFPIALIAAFFCYPVQASFLDGISSAANSEESQDDSTQNSKQSEASSDDEEDDIILVSHDSAEKSTLEKDLAQDRLQLLAFSIADDADNVDFSQTADLSDDGD